MRSSFQDSGQRRLGGFTLLEVIITLAITSVLFVLGMYVYLLVNARFQKARRDQNFYGAYYVFKSALRRDFREADMVWKADGEGGNVLVLERNDSSVRYRFDSTCIVRSTADRIDSFHLGGVLESVYYYNDTARLVSGVRLRHVYNGKTWYTALNRLYSARDIMRFLILKSDE